MAKLLAELTPPFPPSFMASRRYRWAAGLTFAFFVFFVLSNNGFLSQKPLKFQGSIEVDWSCFAYTQYVTNSDYLCNSVMFFESLDRLSSRADRVMMYPSHMFEANNGSSVDTQLLIKARDEYRVKLVPITADSYTKLLAFNQTQYSRVLSIDSDSTLLQDMDELFLSPPAPVAMPRAYWLFPEKEILSSQVILIQPSEKEFARIMAKVDSASENDFDMEIVNYLYRESALVLPHRPYDLLTGEFRADNHKRYLGSDTEPWDPATVYNEAKLVHFSDWPLPKPWIQMDEELRLQSQPNCTTLSDGAEDCAARINMELFLYRFQTEAEGNLRAERGDIAQGRVRGMISLFLQMQAIQY
ncbi:nucleotide-diphospho-sugar transferase [Fusarium oxysporum]|nr:nucleotide-diphospho-sugar transferase [Fusarium oxysporum]